MKNIFTTLTSSVFGAQAMNIFAPITSAIFGVNTMKKRTQRLQQWFGYGARPEELELRTLLSAVTLIADDQAGQKQKKSQVNVAPAVPSTTGNNLDQVFATFDMSDHGQVERFVKTAAVARKKTPAVGGNLSGFSATATASTTGQVIGQQKVMTLTINAGKRPANFFGAQFNVGPGVRNIEMKINGVSFGDVSLDGTGGTVSIGQASYRTIPKNGVLRVDVFATVDANANGIASFVSATLISARRPGVGKKAIDLTAFVTGNGSKASFTAGAAVVRSISITGERPLNQGETTVLTANLSTAATTDTVINLGVPSSLTVLGGNLVTIPAGMTSANFTVQAVNTGNTSSITAILTANSIYGTDTAQIPINGATVVNRTINITGEGPMNQGDTKALTVNLSSAAATDTLVNLTATSGVTIVGGNSVTIPAGATSVNFNVLATSTGNTSAITAIVTASTSSYGSDTASITVNGAVIVLPAHLVTEPTGNDTTIGEPNAQLGVVGYTDQIGYYLDNDPHGTVIVTVTSDDTVHGTVGPMTLTFNSSNYQTKQYVTVTPGTDIDGVNNMFHVNAVSSVGNSSVLVTVIDAGIPVVNGAEYDFAVLRIKYAPGLTVPGNVLNMGPIHFGDAEGGVIDPTKLKGAADLDGNGSAGDPGEYIAGTTIAVGPAGSGSVVNMPGVQIGRGGLLVQIRSNQTGAASIRLVPDSFDFTDGAGNHYRCTITVDPANQWYWDVVITGLV